MTGIALEFNLLSLHSNIVNGVANHNSIVKKIKIGQSAAKFPRNRKKVHRLITSPNVFRIMDNKLTRVRDTYIIGNDIVESYLKK